MWKDKSVLVTGGASFIGSHLVDSLLKKGAIVKVADDLSSGNISNLKYPLKKIHQDYYLYKNLSLYIGDLKDRRFTKSVIKDVNIIFHLAALHGGRGYIKKNYKRSKKINR